MSVTHEVAENGARSLREMLGVARVIVRKGDEGGVLAAAIAQAEHAAAELERLAKECRPSAALVAWGRGEREASKNYNPPASRPK
jgi:hypothetical protein